MNQRFIKKMRQFMRRKEREKLTEYFSNLPQLRPKPFWAPKFIWKILYKIIFK